MTEVDHQSALEHAVGRFSLLMRECDLSQPVGHLGRWKLRDLVAHLGGVHRWANQIVAHRSMDGASSAKSKLDGTELCDWFDEGAAQLVERLKNNDVNDACPNFNPGSDKTIGWWVRRQAHETTVHRWDLERALECTSSIEKVLAADGVDEFLDVFVRTRGKQTLDASLVLNTSQPKRSWTLTPATKPGRIDVSAGSDDESQASVSGPAEGMLLALWGRRSAAEAELSISGDTAAAASLLTL